MKQKTGKMRQVSWSHLRTSSILNDVENINIVNQYCTQPNSNARNKIALAKNRNVRNKLKFLV